MYLSNFDSLIWNPGSTSKVVKYSYIARNDSLLNDTRVFIVKFPIVCDHIPLKPFRVCTFERISKNRVIVASQEGVINVIIYGFKKTQNDIEILKTCQTIFQRLGLRI